ncbi:MAG: DUF58 domain-containing protein [Bacillota bacterium]
MKLLRSLYLTQRFFVCLWTIVALLVFGFFNELLLFVGKLAFFVCLILLACDLVILYRIKKGITARRSLPGRLSNGDENTIRIFLESFYPFKTYIEVIDEIPFQFQVRDFKYKTSLNAAEQRLITYQLRPVERGEYNFGNINAFVSSPLRLVQRRFRFSDNKIVAVYPSFIQMKKYELLAISDRLTELGIKKVRRLGHSTEFEQIKEYVSGDDYRTINWKATARRHKLMVNNYDEEKSQQVYNVINSGRVMKMPFNKMTLLDYAINTSLVVSKIAIQKQDKAGIITFSDKVNTILPADNRQGQMAKILEVLYRQSTDFMESDYELLAASVLSKISHRSLIILYTNFESLESVKRQMPVLKRLALNHLVLAVFFENTEMRELLNRETSRTSDIYIKTIAEKFAYEKRQIIKELEKYNILSVLTSPEELSVNTINKYLEIKTRNMI